MAKTIYQSPIPVITGLDVHQPHWRAQSNR